MLVSHWPELSTWPHPPAGTAGKCRLVPGSCVPSLKKKKNQGFYYDGGKGGHIGGQLLVSARRP